MVSRRFATAIQLSAEIMQQRGYEVRKTFTLQFAFGFKRLAKKGRQIAYVDFRANGAVLLETSLQPSLKL